MNKVVPRFEEARQNAIAAWRVRSLMTGLAHPRQWFVKRKAWLMRKVLHLVLPLGVVLGIGSAALSAKADDPAAYCRSYADAAMNASRAARNHDRCLHFVQEVPARWSLNYQGHFRFCMGAFGSGGNQREWDTRTAQLNECIPSHHW